MAPLRLPLACCLALVAAWCWSAPSANAATTRGCTIIASRQMRVVIGTNKADRICVEGRGHHVIYGRGGDDVIWDAAASDVIHGGSGNDTVYANGGQDTVFGGDGSDTIYGGAGDDTITGLAGNDDLAGAEGDDVVHGGEGADSVDGGNGGDAVSGDAGGDVAAGGPGPDTVDGGDGSDLVLGGDNSDQLTGGAGDDQVNGGLGDDDLSGGPGTNTCDGGGGNDHLDLTCDSSKPQLQWMSFSQTSADSSQSDVQVTVTARFTDDLSGFDAATIGSYAGEAHFTLADQISGDALDGVYRTTFTVRRYTSTGTWPLSVITRDRVGNWGWGSSSQLQSLDLPWQFSQTGPGDDTAPTASTISLSSTSLDSSSGPASIDATVHVDDDMSGFGSLLIILNGPAGQIGRLYFNHAARTSGTAVSGDYAGSIDLPHFAASGDWQVAGGTIDDLAGNRRNFSTAEAVALLGGVEAVTETGLGDDTPPVAESLSVTSDGTDPSIGDVQVNMTMHATDDLSGFSHADCLASPPSIVIYRDVYVSWGSRISGDTMDGNYQLTFTIPQYSQRGLWTVTCRLYDFVGNHTTTPTAVMQIG